MEFDDYASDDESRGPSRNPVAGARHRSWEDDFRERLAMRREQHRSSTAAQVAKQEPRIATPAETKILERPLIFEPSTAAPSVLEGVGDRRGDGGACPPLPDLPSWAEKRLVDRERPASSSTTSATSIARRHERAAGVAAADDCGEPQYPRSWRLAVIMVAVCLAVFCMALDNTIIATAIPKITDQFHALEDVAWYGSAYLLTTCAFQLFFARLYSFFSIKLVFLAAVGTFEVGSLVCATAPSSVALIVGRAIAGLGSAGIFAGAILIIAHTVPLRKRAIYTGAVGSMYGIASVLGPILGGIFTDRLTWRWCFYINLPIGGVTIFFVTFFFTSPVRSAQAALTWRQKLRRLDLPGTGIFVPAIVCLLLALEWGGSTYSWSDGRVIALLVVFCVLTCIFLAIQNYQQDNATVPPRVFCQRSVAAAAWFAVTLGGAFFICIYYVPIWFQSVRRVSAVRSGIDSLPLVLAVSLFSLVSGVGVTVLGYYTPWMLASSVLMAVGCGLISTFTPTTGIGTWIGYQIIAGSGFGMGIQNPLIVVQTVLPLADVPVGTALIMFSQTLGGALFIAVAQNVFLNELAKDVQKYIPGFSIKLLLQAGATALPANLSPTLLGEILASYNSALNQAFHVATAMAAFSVLGAAFVQWKSVKGTNLLAGGAA